ncbi:MAG: M3 family oligoendopeptidase [Planctomycetota bacterium]|nr:M3 family oligoendopeptidase [Planctomycetota bacterium]
MPVEALQNLPKAQPRQFVPETCDLGDWAQLEPLFRQLQEEAAKLKNPKQLERWVLKASELGAALYQEEAKRYINMTCQTDDKDAEQSYLQFVEQIEPKMKPEWQKLDQLFLASPFREKLPQKRWMVYERDVRKDVELFREENVALQTEESKLGQKYQKTMGAMTVTFQEKEQTLQQMGRYLEEPDRALREKAWRLVSERRLRDKEAIDGIYDELIALRGKIAANAGFASYRDYAFRAKGRFDYGPEACEDFHKAVEEVVVPVARRLQQRRRKLMGLRKLRPWDLGVDPRNRPPLKPFADVPTLVDKTHEIFRRIDPALGQDFDLLRGNKLLELDSRKGKAPGGYQHSLEEARMPFIFMNAVGLQRDVETLLHEGGHAFHSIATRDEPLLAYRHAPIEFCEVASMSMELLGGPHLEVFYSEEDAKRARRVHLEGIVGLLPWVATIDAFQHWVYTHPGHTPGQRREFWVTLMDRFGGTEDWTGLEEARANLWQRQLHLFLHPFYYIEYGIAQLGALQVWLKSKKDVAKAVANYRKGLSLGRSRPLPDLFRAAGIKFDFSAKTVKPLVNAIRKELKAAEDV